MYYVVTNRALIVITIIVILINTNVAINIIIVSVKNMILVIDPVEMKYGENRWNIKD